MHEEPWTQGGAILEVMTRGDSKVASTQNRLPEILTIQLNLHASRYASSAWGTLRVEGPAPSPSRRSQASESLDDRLSGRCPGGKKTANDSEET